MEEQQQQKRLFSAPGVTLAAHNPLFWVIQQNDLQARKAAARLDQHVSLSLLYTGARPEQVDEAVMDDIGYDAIMMYLLLDSEPGDIVAAKPRNNASWSDEGLTFGEMMRLELYGHFKFVWRENGAKQNRF